MGNHPLARHTATSGIRLAGTPTVAASPSIVPSTIARLGIVSPMNQTVVDTSIPSIARVYDASLGGKDNFLVDRKVYQDFLRVAPDMRNMARNNRRWLARVVGYLADLASMDQFLDLGSGLPTVQNTHEIAQQWNRDSVVVYVDNDPAVNVYGRALLEENEQTHFATADLRRPHEVGGTPEARKLDWNRPMVLMQVGTLLHVDDENDPWSSMREWVELIPHGSYVAITHPYNPNDGTPLAEQATALEHAFHGSAMESGLFRARDQITPFFDGLQLIRPGLVPLAEWYPSGPAIDEPGVERLLLGGVGYKP